MIVGLTGGIGCGKSTVAKMFQELEVMIISSDEISRQLLSLNQPTLAKVVQHFGTKILNEDRSLNRNLLRHTIFSSQEERLWLETLLHPLIKTEILKQSSNVKKDDYAIVEIPLLLEAHFQAIVNRILVVDCPRYLQIERVTKRDKVASSVVQTMIKSQVSRAERISNADDLIENIGDIITLQKKVEALHQYYKKLCK